MGDPPDEKQLCMDELSSQSSGRVPLEAFLGTADTLSKRKCAKTTGNGVSPKKQEGKRQDGLDDVYARVDGKTDTRSWQDDVELRQDVPRGGSNRSKNDSDRIHTGERDGRGRRDGVKDVGSRRGRRKDAHRPWTGVQRQGSKDTGSTEDGSMNTAFGSRSVEAFDQEGSKVESREDGNNFAGSKNGSGDAAFQDGSVDRGYKQDGANDNVSMQDGKVEPEQFGSNVEYHSLARQISLTDRSLLHTTSICSAYEQDWTTPCVRVSIHSSDTLELLQSDGSPHSLPSFVETHAVTRAEQRRRRRPKQCAPVISAVTDEAEPAAPKATVAAVAFRDAVRQWRSNDQSISSREDSTPRRAEKAKSVNSGRERLNRIRDMVASPIPPYIGTFRDETLPSPSPLAGARTAINKTFSNAITGIQTLTTLSPKVKPVQPDLPYDV